MQLIGLARIGRDAVLRRTPAGDAVINLALAYNYGKKDQNGNKPSQWVDGSLWGAQAEAMEQYLLKGQLLCVTIEGVHMESYQSGGVEKWKLVGIINKLEFAGRNPNESAPAPAQQKAPAPQQNRNQSQQRPAQSRPAPNFSNMDDDIPF
jgi:single-strand DNA-binding protein